jgi:hypothetical protein
MRRTGKFARQHTRRDGSGHDPELLGLKPGETVSFTWITRLACSRFKTLVQL